MIFSAPLSLAVAVAGIPAALQGAGLVSGLLLLLFVTALTDYTLLLLIEDGIIAGKFTYQVSFGGLV